MIYIAQTNDEDTDPVIAIPENGTKPAQDYTPPFYTWIIFAAMLLLGFWVYGKRYPNKRRHK